MFAGRQALDRAHAGGHDPEIVAPLDGMTKKTLRHGAATDISGAHEKNRLHSLFNRSSWGGTLKSQREINPAFLVLAHVAPTGSRLYRRLAISKPFGATLISLSIIRPTEINWLETAAPLITLSANPAPAPVPGQKPRAAEAPNRALAPAERHSAARRHDASAPVPPRSGGGAAREWAQVAPRVPRSGGGGSQSRARTGRAAFGSSPSRCIRTSSASVVRWCGTRLVASCAALAGAFVKPGRAVL